MRQPARRVCALIAGMIADQPQEGEGLELQASRTVYRSDNANTLAAVAGLGGQVMYG